MFCTKCAHANTDSANFCSACGTPFAQPALPEPQSGGDGLELYQAFVGPRNQGYYVSRFARYLNKGRAGLSWHWPAFFLTFYWFLYRKMWSHAFVYFVLPFIVFLPLLAIIAYLSDSSETAIGVFYAGWALFYWALPPMLGNALYFRHCKRKIEEVTATSITREHRVGELLAKGGTSNAVPILVGMILFVPTLGILAAIAIPAYQAHAISSKLSEAESFGMTAARAVAEYYEEHEEVPETLAAAGFSSPLPGGVGEIFVAANGTIAIKVKSTDPAVDGKHLLIVPSADEENNISWTCLSREIKQRYLPKRCRDPQVAV